MDRNEIDKELRRIVDEMDDNWVGKEESYLYLTREEENLDKDLTDFEPEELHAVNQYTNKMRSRNYLDIYQTTKEVLRRFVKAHPKETTKLKETAQKIDWVQGSIKPKGFVTEKEFNKMMDSYWEHEYKGKYFLYSLWHGMESTNVPTCPLILREKDVHDGVFDLLLVNGNTTVYRPDQKLYDLALKSIKQTTEIVIKDTIQVYALSDDGFVYHAGARTTQYKGIDRQLERGCTMAQAVRKTKSSRGVMGVSRLRHLEERLGLESKSLSALTFVLSGLFNELLDKAEAANTNWRSYIKNHNLNFLKEKYLIFNPDFRKAKKVRLDFDNWIMGEYANEIDEIERRRKEGK